MLFLKNFLTNYSTQFDNTYLFTLKKFHPSVQNKPLRSRIHTNLLIILFPEEGEEK